MTGTLRFLCSPVSRVSERALAVTMSSAKTVVRNAGNIPTRRKSLQSISKDLANAAQHHHLLHKQTDETSERAALMLGDADRAISNDLASIKLE